MSTRYFEALFNPASIVVIGASEKPQSLGGMVLRNLLASGYPGELLVVNQTGYENVHGVPCVRKVKNMPFRPELAIICTPPETVPRMLRQLGLMGLKAAMVMTGGLSRTHSLSGRPLMHSVEEAVRETGIRVLGPNTIGIMAPGRQMNATYAHMGALPGKVAFIGQSGAIASAILDWAFARGVGFSHLVTLGDGIDIDIGDLIDYFTQDRDTKAILLHIENIKNPRSFISAVRAASRTKPVVALKSGQVRESQWHPQTIPAGIVDGDQIYNAVLRRAGVLRVYGTDEMFDGIEALTKMRPVRKETLAILSNGVGPGVLAVDRLASMGGELSPLAPETTEALEKLLPPYWTRKNPIDLNYDATPELYAQALQILNKDPEISNVLVMYSPSLTEDSLEIAEAVIKAASRTRLTVFTCWLGQSTVLDARAAFARAGIPTFFTPDKAIKAFMHQINHQRSQRLLRQTPKSHIDVMVGRERVRELIRTAKERQRNYLNNAEARQLIREYQIPTVDTWYCGDEDEVIKAFREIGKPVTITLLHRQSYHPFMEQTTGRGRHRGTIRRLNTEEALRESCRVLLEQFHFHYPSSTFLGFAVQESFKSMGGVAFSVGITRDPVFGPLVVCGAGGAAVNVLTDRRVALPPLNMVLAKDLLRQTFMYKLLKEYSYHPEQDIHKVCETLVKLSQIVVDNPEIKGLEILPLLFTREGVIAVDVAVDLGEPAKLCIQPYPDELQEIITLPRSGRRVELRPVRSEDEPAHLELHTNLSPESIRYRFFHYRKSFTHDELAQMVQIDYDREMVFIASAPKEDGKGEETLGTVRTWTDADNLQAEFAVLVSEKMKGEGLGSILMKKMIEYCRSRGTVEMVGTVLPDNRPMLKLAEKLGFEIRYDPEEEVMALRLELNPPSKDWQIERLRPKTKTLPPKRSGLEQVFKS